MPDAEVDALYAISQALSPLDRNTAARVLEWARKRYVDIDTQLMSADQMQSLSKFTDAILKTAVRLEMAKPVDLITAIARVVDKVDEIEVEKEVSADA